MFGDSKCIYILYMICGNRLNCFIRKDKLYWFFCVIFLIKDNLVILK